MRGEYWGVLSPHHPCADINGYVAEHRLVAERALGRVIERRHEVHHVNRDRLDNRPSNLVICEDHAYHLLLHTRQRALDACGNPDWKKCRFCKRYDEVGTMEARQDRRAVQHTYAHPECRRHYEREKYAETRKGSHEFAEFSHHRRGA